MKRRLIFAFLSVALACVIFWFSSRTGSQSQEQSDDFIYLFFSRFLSDGISAALSFMVRKAAHFSVYAALGGFVCAAVTEKAPSVQTVCFSQIITMLYAASDEIHQYFVPERACQLRDVCIDSLGALLGVFITSFIIFFAYKHKKRSVC